MRIFNLTVFLGLCILCAVLDFLFIETDPYVLLADGGLSAAAIAAIAGGSALVSGVGNLLDSASTNKANKQIAKENREWQTVENEKSRQYSREMWEKENLYNTPSAQMQRMREAGLNPYLVGQQGAASGNATSANQPSQQGAPNPVDIKRSDYGFIQQGANNAVNAYNEVRSVDANVANQSAQTEKTIINNAHELYRLTGDKDRVNNYINTQLKGSKGASFDPDTSPLAQSLKADITRQEMEAEKADSERAKNDAEVSIIRLLGYKQGQATIRNLDAMTEKYFGEVNKLSSDVDVNKANIGYINKRANAIGAEMAKYFAEAHYYGAQGNQIKLATDYIVSDFKYRADMSRIQNNNMKLQYNINRSNYFANQKVREFRETEAGQNLLKWNYLQSPDANVVNSVLNGFTNSLNIMHGSDLFNSNMHYNFNYK